MKLPGNYLHTKLEQSVEQAETNREQLLAADQSKLIPVTFVGEPFLDRPSSAETPTVASWICICPAAQVISLYTANSQWIIACLTEGFSRFSLELAVSWDNSCYIEQ